jgi:hypothetical protein
LSVAIFEFEHITPRSAGGKTKFENLCMSCPTCNRYQAHQTTALDPVSDEEVVLFHLHQIVWADHFEWSDDGAEIIGLTPTGRATIEALRMNRTQKIRVRRMWHVMGEHPPRRE